MKTVITIEARIRSSRLPGNALLPVLGQRMIEPLHRVHPHTVDTEADLSLVPGIYEALYPANPAFGLREILDPLAAKPQLALTNQPVRQKAARMETA